MRLFNIHRCIHVKQVKRVHADALHHFLMTLGGITFLHLGRSRDGETNNAPTKVDVSSILGQQHSNHRISARAKLVVLLRCDSNGRQKERGEPKVAPARFPDRLWLRPRGDVTESQPVTRGRTTLLLCSGARHHKIITHHALFLSALLSF